MAELHRTLTSSFVFLQRTHAADVARLTCVLVRAQIHMTQGATPSAMYISWVTGNASYTYCSQDDNATCGDATNACYCNASPAAFASSQVKYSTDEGLQNAMIGQEAGDYPVTVRRARPALLLRPRHRPRVLAASSRGVHLVGSHVTQAKQRLNVLLATLAAAHTPLHTAHVHVNLSLNGSQHAHAAQQAPNICAFGGNDDLL